MTAQNDVVEFLKSALFMSVSHVGDRVFFYDVDVLDSSMLPCITVTIEDDDQTEASTSKNIVKKFLVSIKFHAGRNNEFWNVRTLYAMRESLTKAIDKRFDLSKPVTLVDFAENSVGSFEPDYDTEIPMITQACEYTFLTKETDY